MNRLGFRLRRVQKTKPAKKIKQTDAIFENVERANREADEDPGCLRISFDSKAKLKIGELSRGGKSRGEKKTLDHDMKAKATRVPFGILEMHGNGTLLDSIDKALEWAKTMTWKGIRPVVQLLNKVYKTGVRLTRAALKPFEQRIDRSQSLPKWSASILPRPTIPDSR